MELSSISISRRRADVRDGVRIEVITVVWMIAEASIAITAGVMARSVLLTAFGIDSVIELAAGSVLLWRLVTEARGRSLQRVERAEHWAAWTTGAGLSLLCVYVVATALFSLIAGVRADGSLPGIGLAVVTLPMMIWLVRQKRVIARKIDSPALRADAACSLTCAYMAGALLLGVVLTTTLGWWWADSIAALALLYWLVPETREALQAARTGERCACCDH